MDHGLSFLPFRDRLMAAAAAAPAKIAIRDEAGALTYGDLAAKVGAFAKWLAAEGVGRGDMLAICAANSLDYGFAYVAAAAGGVVVVPLPQSATEQSLAGMIADCGARLVLADEANMARLKTVPIEAELMALEGLAGSLEPGGAGPAGAPARPDEIFNIIYSSGTTGTPKGIVQSNAMRDAHFELGRACNYGPDAVTLVSTPLYSNTSLVSFLPTIALGGTAVLMKKFDAETFLVRSETLKVTHAMLVPVQYRRLLAHPHFGDFDLSAYREKFCTSAPFSAELKREVLDRWPGNLTEYYGMTEGGGLCILFASAHPDKLHTVGRPAPDNDIRVIDDDGVELPKGSMGEVVGRSRSLMDGYHGRPDATRAAFWQSPDGQTFMRTGDVGRFDEDGFLILLDRKKDVIISGGFNVYPSDLEAVIKAHPAVDDVAVVGVASERWGETPVAFVVARRSDATEAELMEFSNARLGKSQRLAAVRLVDRLPRSSIGKVLKRELREAFGTLPVGA